MLDGSQLESPETKKAVALTFAYLGPRGEAAVDTLVAYVRLGGIDPRIDVRSPPDQRDKSAQGALASMGKAAVRPVAALLSSHKGEVRTDALRILATIGEPALDAEEELLIVVRHPSLATRLAALRMLQDIGALTPALKDAIQNLAQADADSAVRDEAHKTLEKTAEPQRPR